MPTVTLLTLVIDLLVGIAAARLDGGLMAAVQAVKDRLKTAKQMENHDLIRALLISFIQAQESICEEYLQDPQKYIRLPRHEADWLDQHLKSLRAEHDKIKEASVAVFANVEFPFDDMVLLVTPPQTQPTQHQTGQPDTPQATRTAALRARLADEALRRAGPNPPPCYKAEVQATLYERLSGFFALQIKYTDPVRHIFSAHLEAVAHLQNKEMQDALQRIEDQLRASAAGLPQLTGRLSAIEQGIGRLDGRMTDRLNEVVAYAAARFDQIHAELKRIRGSRPGAPVPNLRRPTTHFVGRETELEAAARSLFLGAPGTVTVLHGFGGMGKTELATAFAQQYQHRLAAGAWELHAQNQTDLLTLIGTLTYALELPPSAGPDETAPQRGRRVLSELRRRATETGAPEEGGAVLLVLDNLSEVELLGEDTLLEIPREGWLKIIATTRLGPGDLRTSGLQFLTVDRLPEEPALQLLRSYQQGKQWPAATAGEDAAAALALVRELDGFTLAVQTVAVYLGHHRDIRPADYLERLRSEGVSSTDALPGADRRVAAQIPHREKQLALVLNATLERMAPLARTTLNLAALFPPDHVVWPWLRALVEHEHPGGLDRLKGYPDPWAEVRRQLADLHWLTPTEHPEVARLHRVVGAHLQGRLGGAEGARTLGLVRAQLVKAACALEGDWKDRVEHPWELAPLQAAAAQWEPGARDAAYSLVARVVGKIELILGRLDVAEPFLEGALEASARIYAANPESVSARRNVSLDLHNLANFLAQRGQPGDGERALSYYERSLKLHQQRLDSNLEADQAMRELSVSLWSLGDFLVERRQPGDTERALLCYERSLTHSQQMLAANPHSVEAVRFVSNGLTKIADFFADRSEPGDTARALDGYRRSLDLDEQRFKASPNSAEAIRDFAVALNKLAGFLSRRGEPGDLEQALGYYEQSRGLSERLLASNLSSTQAARDVSISLGKLADLLIKRNQPGDTAQALGYYERSLKLDRQLLAANPGSAQAARDVLVTLERLADATGAQQADNGTHEALVLQQQALKLAEQLWARNPSSAFYGSTLVRSLWRAAWFAQEAGEDDLTAQYLRACHGLLKHLTESGFELDPNMHDMYAELIQELGAPD